VLFELVVGHITLERMKPLARSIGLGVAVLLVDLVTYAVLSHNLESGVYSDRADSIGLPIGLTLVASVLLLPAFTLVTTAQRLLAAAGTRRWLRALVLVSVAFAYVFGAAIAAGGLLYWFAPDHYAIAAAYAALGVWLARCAYADIPTMNRGPHAL
jgi:hypothetical protein